jgi:hypothetical protein
MTWLADNMSQDQLVKSGLALAVRYVVLDVESTATLTPCDEPGKWYDTSAMVDHKKWPTEVIAQHIDVLRFGEAAAVLLRHPKHRQLMRVLVCADEQEAR